MALDLTERRRRAAARQHRGGPSIRRQLVRRRATRSSRPARRKFAGSPMAMPEPPVISASSAAASPRSIRWRSLIASAIAWRTPVAPQLGEARADRRGALVDHAHMAPARPAPALALQHARPGCCRSSGSAGGGACGCRRAACRRRTDGPGRRCDRCSGKAGQAIVRSAPSASQQRLADRPDVAAIGRIEGRAVFEQDLRGRPVRAAMPARRATGGPRRRPRSCAT